MGRCFHSLVDTSCRTFIATVFARLLRASPSAFAGIGAVVPDSSATSGRPPNEPRGSAPRDNPPSIMTNNGTTLKVRSDIECSNAGVECRDEAGPCDAAECDATERCSGAGPLCPADQKRPNGDLCTDDGLICTADVCNGVVDACTHPGGNAGTVCRPANGACDAAEACSGTATTCPADAFREPSFVCRSAAGECDVAEYCVGDTAECPTDVFVPLGAPCNENDSSCDGVGSCVGAPVSYNSGLYLPPRVAADGHVLALAVVTLRNAAGQFVANKRVQFSALGAEVFDPTNLTALVRTNVHGQAAVFVRSAQVGQARVVASWANGLESVSGPLDFVTPVPALSKTLPSAGGNVRLIIDTVGAVFDDAHDYDREHLLQGLPVRASIPLGMRAATIKLYPGQTEAQVTVLMPAPIPASHRLWMYGPTPDDRRPHWVDVTYSQNVSGLKDEDATYVVRLVDGGFGDADGEVNGYIVDPKGISNDPAEIPTLDQWALILLALAFVAVALRRLGAARVG